MLTLALGKTDWLNLVYLLAAVLFCYGLKGMSRVETARRGNAISAAGMLIASVATLFFITGATAISLVWVILAVIIGAVVGTVMSLRVPMTGMPQMVALLNGFGGNASLLVACADYIRNPDPSVFATWHEMLSVGLATLIGGVTFTGSLVAFAKLQGLSIIPDKPVQFVGQKLIIAAMLLLSMVLTVVLVAKPSWGVVLLPIAIMALVLGILLVVGIGGADMPVVVSLLNSYSGLAASMAGFVLGNFALIITGSLVGASGLILTNIMCKAMNRSLMNVLFGGMGATVAGPSGGGPEGTHREFSAEDAALVLEAAQQVMFVPGYGMAVAQAQHAVKELADLLISRGVTVRYAIHPVAGRMPGHMNVLLAEAGAPYEQLLDLDHANPEFDKTDVALVVGANDVTNPAARHDESSPIYGMPILDVDQARQVFVVKRSMNPGFAGIQNELYFKTNCGMVFGDAKKVITDLANELEQI